MKTFTRIMIGLTSSLLAIAGLICVAEKLDPLSQSLRGAPAIAAVADQPGENCALPCHYAPEARDRQFS